MAFGVTVEKMDPSLFVEMITNVSLCLTPHKHLGGLFRDCDYKCEVQRCNMDCCNLNFPQECIDSSI